MASSIKGATAYLKAAAPDSEPTVLLGEDDSTVLRPLGHGLLVAYLVDEGDRFSYVQGLHLRQDRISPDELHDIGLRNLDAVATAHVEVRECGPCVAVLAGGVVEASLVLLDHLWDAELHDLAPNGVVAALPARDVLAFADGANADGVRELRSVVARVWPRGDHLLIDQLLRRRGRGWTQLGAAS
jgi:hypothetical protein